MIEAISFDRWDTLIRNDSDKPKRAALGLRIQHGQRRHALWEACKVEYV